MKNESVGFVRAVLFTVLLSVGVAASAEPPAAKLTPQQLAAKAQGLLRELAQLGRVIDLDTKSDPLTVQVACQCSPPVSPNGVTVVVVPHPHPPLDTAEVQRALTFILAINQMKVPEMNLEKATVTVKSLRTEKISVNSEATKDSK